MIGVPLEGWLSPPAEVARLLDAADVVAVAPRLASQADGLVRKDARVLSISGDLAPLLDEVERAEGSGKLVAVLATGDPGLFGIARALSGRLGRQAVRILPAASSVSVAFGRIGLPWDDARVVSAHGRSLADAIAALRGAEKAAVLTSPDSPPEKVARALLESGQRYEHAAVASDLGSANERVEEGKLESFSKGTYRALSVVLVWNGTGVAPEPVVGSGGGNGAPGTARLSFGRSEHEFAHRAGMITKSEVRATCLGLLSLPVSGVLWDVGAGSGSVAIEAASLAPKLRVIAIERSAEATALLEANVRLHRVAVEVINSEAPSCLAWLPRPDRAFVGGGGPDVLAEVLRRLEPAGRIVASFASMDRAVAAGQLLGNLTQLSVNRGVRLPDRTWRLSANEPVFICWGPGEAPE
ncbi:MAG: precorrin-6y C5,15-methyltransferase (decarboxylating) subunit CbiE [Acidimicrobiales bacterium]